MYFSNRGIKADRTLEGKFSFENSLGVSNSERQAITEAYEDDTTILEGAPDDGYVSQIQDQEALVEAAIFQKISIMPDAERLEFINSDHFNSLLEAGVIGRKALLEGLKIMGAEGEYERTWHLTAMELAKQNGDANFEALRKLRLKEKQLKDKIYNKYKTRAQQEAKKLMRRTEKIAQLRKEARIGKEAYRQLEIDKYKEAVKQKAADFSNPNIR